MLHGWFSPQKLKNFLRTFSQLDKFIVRMILMFKVIFMKFRYPYLNFNLKIILIGYVHTNTANIKLEWFQNKFHILTELLLYTQLTFLLGKGE